MPLNLQDIIKLGLVGSGSGGSSGGGGGIPQADIDAAFAALAEKGVTIPEGATSADLDELIASIVTGGGIDGYDTLQGTFTVSEDVTSGYHTIECKRVATKPTYMYSLVYMIDGFPNNNGVEHLVAAVGSTILSYSSYKQTGAYLYSSGGGGSVKTSITGNEYIAFCKNNRLIIDLYTNGNPLRAGVTYGWVFFYK
jgi:hypothetical protein